MVFYSEEYKEYLASDAWKQRRGEELERAGYRCEGCGKSRAVVRLEVHHVTYEHFGSEWIGDLKVLCVACHIKADRDRREEMRQALWDRRVEAWARKVYGNDPGTWPLDVEEPFLDWLARQGDV